MQRTREWERWEEETGGSKRQGSGEGQWQYSQNFLYRAPPECTLVLCYCKSKLITLV